MNSTTTQHTIEALDALLERERTALMEGDLNFLAGQYDEKKTLIDRLNDNGAAGAAKLEQLQAKALRNQALLNRALQGIRSVANRMSTLQRIRQTLDTYDETGKRRAIEGQTDLKMEKRA
ncbi:hypothetical protein LZG00_01475 [Rhodobacteraceae bacterium LMO-12]|nr:hypothetical protein [Rhodobacteraceae bacterium LMO-JJ12]